jgi:hypothetical protein
MMLVLNVQSNILRNVIINDDEKLKIIDNWIVFYLFTFNGNNEHLIWT